MKRQENWLSGRLVNGILWRVVLLGGLIAALASAGPHAWKVYDNSRFGYSICYPEDLLIPQGEAGNGDGQKFVAKDGGTLTVFGSNNAQESSLREEMKLEWADLGKVTYRLVKANWAVVSGENAATHTIFYAKMILAHGQFKTFQITYPASEAGQYKPIVTKMSACFVSKKAAF